MSESLKSILYVDDDLDIQAIARVVLEKIGGFSVEICDSGLSALERLQSFAPDMVLMDVMMPDMDGLTTLQKLREDPTTSQIPVVFMTAKVQSHEVAEYREKGALGVIYKPFDPMILPETIQEIWRERLDSLSA